MMESRSIFTNDHLVAALIEFICVVDARMVTLRAQVDITTLPEHENSVKQLLPETLVEGICTDFVREIRHSNDVMAIAQRNMSSDVMQEFNYVLAAWADETLIRTFRDRLPRRYNGAVENLLFGTRDAGEQVFTKIERVIARRSHGDSGLAAAYLLMLSLGFRGQYPEQSEHETLLRYHRELSAMTLVPVTQVAEPGSVTVPHRPVGISRWSTHRQYTGLWILIGALWLLAVIGMEFGWRNAIQPIRHALAELTVVTATPGRPAAIGARP